MKEPTKPSLFENLRRWWANAILLAVGVGAGLGWNYLTN